MKLTVLLLPFTILVSTLFAQAESEITKCSNESETVYFKTTSSGELNGLFIRDKQGLHRKEASEYHIMTVRVFEDSSDEEFLVEITDADLENSEPQLYNISPKRGSKVIKPKDLELRDDKSLDVILVCKSEAKRDRKPPKKRPTHPGRPGGPRI